MQWILECLIALEMVRSCSSTLLREAERYPDSFSAKGSGLPREKTNRKYDCVGCRDIGTEITTDMHKPEDAASLEDLLRLQVYHLHLYKIATRNPK